MLAGARSKGALIPKTHKRSTVNAEQASEAGLGRDTATHLPALPATTYRQQRKKKKNVASEIGIITTQMERPRNAATPHT